VVSTSGSTSLLVKVTFAIRLRTRFRSHHHHYIYKIYVLRVQFNQDCMLDSPTPPLHQTKMEEECTSRTQLPLAAGYTRRHLLPVDRSASCSELLLRAASGACVVIGEAAVLQPQRRRRGSLRAQQLGLQHGAVVGERLRRHVQVEADAEQEVHLQVVHLHQADAPDLGEVGVVVASAQILIDSITRQL
jgi:hypothetical protein